MSDHVTYIAEHGASRTTLYGSCSCGWSGRPRRRYELAVQDCRIHEAREELLAELEAVR